MISESRLYVCALVCDTLKFKIMCIFSLFDKTPKLLIQDDIFEVSVLSHHRYDIVIMWLSHDYLMIISWLAHDYLMIISW